MEEKERYEWFNQFDNRIVDNNELAIIDVVKRLNQQDKRIKELEEEVKILKTNKAHFKKVAENVVDLLGKLNKFIGNPQTRDLNYYKVIDDTKAYIGKLKQSQKQLAIKEFNNLLDTFEFYENGTTDTIVYGDYSSVSIYDYIENKIKELEGSKDK